jgi:LysR family nitrogen assimilation transcriptional regulator
MMDLPRLRAFLLASRLGSVSRAAAELRIAQPALSRQIRKLEAELGVTLLVREGRGVRSTEAGEALMRRGEGLFEQIQETIQDVQAHAGRPTGTVTLAIPPGAGKTLLPRLVTEYRDRFPAVNLRIRSALSGSIRDWLSRGEVDVALIHDPPRMQDVELRPLLEEQHDLIAPAAPRATHLPRALSRQKKTVSLEDLARLPLILPGPAHGLRQLIEGLAARERIDLQVTEVDNLELIKTLVEAGVGYSVMAYNAAQEEVRRGVLRAVPIIPTISWQLMLAMPRRRASRAASELVKMIEDLLAELINAGLWRGTMAQSRGETD